MPVIITTQEATTNIEQAQRQVDMADTIYLLQPDEAPFAALLRKLSKKVTINPEFSWLEDEVVPWVDQINNAGGYNDTATSLIVDNGAYFAAGDLVKVFRTGEVFRVTAVTGNTLTVVRGWGTSRAALNDDDYLFNVGSAYAEGALSGPSRMTKKEKRYNYTQIIRTPIKVTGTVEASSLYGVRSERIYQRRKKAVEHNMAINRALWFGVRHEDIGATDAPRRSTGGVTYFLATNKTTLANDAGLTQAAFDAFWETVFYYGSGTRWAFCSLHMATLISALAQNKLQLMQMELGKANNQTFGLRVTQYVSPHGVVNIVVDRTLNDWVASTSPNARGKVLFALDFDPNDGIAYRPLKGRDTKLLTDIQANNADAYEDEYLTEFGLLVAQEKRHGILEIRG